MYEALTRARELRVRVHCRATSRLHLFVVPGRNARSDTDMGAGPAGRAGTRNHSQSTTSAVVVTLVALEVEKIEQVTDGGHVTRYIRIVAILDRVREIVPTAFTQRALELPVSLDEFNDR